MEAMPLEIKLALAVLFLPLLAFAIQIFFGKKLYDLHPQGGHIVPILGIGAGLGISLYLFFTQVMTGGGMEPITWQISWMELGRSADPGASPLNVNFGVLLDNMSVIMLVVVTGVSFLVHVYSSGYMHGEARYQRFFAYLALFSFSMLGLILVDNLLFLFAFWELVGVCSYFLIGWYFEKPSAYRASMKAFMTNRVGDVGFLLGIIIILGVVGSMSYADVFASWAPGSDTWEGKTGLWTLAALCLFCGAVGKSAQFPLHVWLPDAMEGPTPVSALIHAATMVAAGVYMVARLFPFLAGEVFFQGTDVLWTSDALWWIAHIGAITAFMAATMALVQNDIKKVLAYSTISQLGYMILGVGVGTPAMGMFHLWTHAFFKALLFLGSGSVIHAVHSNEMTDMGGLKRKMPITYWTFLIATLALAGLPGTSGFASKEGILTQAMAFGIHKGPLHFLPFVLGILTAGLTAFYMMRVMFLTFWGEPRNQEKFDHAHESPKSMTVPLLVLCVATVVSAGAFCLPFAPKGWNWFAYRMEPDAVVVKYMNERAEPKTGALPVELREATPGEVLLASTASPASLPPEEDEDGSHGDDHGDDHGGFHADHEAAHYPTMGLATLMLIAGVGLAYMFFAGGWKGRDPAQANAAVAWYKNVLVNLYYVDWFYYNVVIRALMTLRVVAGIFDKYVIDGIVNLFGLLTRGLAGISGLFDAKAIDGLVQETGDSILVWGKESRRLQTGKLQDYVWLTISLFGVLLLLFFLVEKFR